MVKLTPAMKQYMEIKERNPDCLVLFRMGDFYETFYEDAKRASRELGITLTKRGAGESQAPLAGIPYHALDQYLSKLVKKGIKVAIVEQLEDPKLAKGVVKRGLTRIVTPGTLIEDSMLSKSSNNYIITVWKDNYYGIACCDISTGEFLCTQIGDESKLLSEIERFNPSEIIVATSQEDIFSNIKKRGFHVDTFDDRFFWKEKSFDTIKEHFDVLTLESFGIDRKDAAAQASGALISYIKETQKNSMSYLKNIRCYSTDDYMIIDSSSLRNLELLRNIRDGTQRGTLFEVLNKTKTSMGARKLKSWVLRPLMNQELIQQRLDSVEELKTSRLLREEISEILANISDIERIISRITYGNSNARDMVSLKNTLEKIPELKNLLSTFNSTLIEGLKNMDELKDLSEYINKAIKDEPSSNLREGNIIKKGFDEALDSLKQITSSGRSWISDFEESERKRTGIKSLKVRYNRVFGYFIEVTKSNLNMVPEDYVRKQTQVNSERFITEELKQKESQVLGAQEKIIALEAELFLNVVEKAVSKSKEIQQISEQISTLDSLLSLSQVAVENNYTKPIIEESSSINIKEGRHPVVERIEAGKFVSNNTKLDDDSMVHIITGPNMAGKSTYLRQIALITIMAQAGSFVPAESALIGIVDRVFTRVGAVDDLSMGQSTFMVEMTEVGNILNNATSNSLVIMDEVGRGTSTYDGLSLAWAITEYIHDNIMAKTLFATHYHQMNRLAKQKERVRNFNISVKESEGEVVFLRKIVEGGTDKSYGIHVAKLAGLPKNVLDRARYIQETLEQQEILTNSVGIINQENDLKPSKPDRISNDDSEEEYKREITITEKITKKKKNKEQLSLFEVIDNGSD